MSCCVCSSPHVLMCLQQPTCPVVSAATLMSCCVCSSPHVLLCLQQPACPDVSAAALMSCYACSNPHVLLCLQQPSCPVMSAATLMSCCVCSSPHVLLCLQQPACPDVPAAALMSCYVCSNPHVLLCLQQPTCPVVLVILNIVTPFCGRKEGVREEVIAAWYNTREEKTSSLPPFFPHSLPPSFLPSFFPSFPVDKNYIMFKEFIALTMKEHIPNKLTSTRTNLPWFNRGLKRMCKVKQRRFKRAKK